MSVTNTPVFNIYLITNNVNNKVYVGKTYRDINFRFQSHKKLLKNGCHPNKHLISSYNKYGAEAFSIELLANTRSEKVANNLENLWIINFASFDPKYGYNKTLGGDGQRPTKETLAKMTGRPCSTETRDKIRRAQKGRPLTQAHRLALCGPRPHLRGNVYALDRKSASTEDIIRLYNKGCSFRSIGRSVGLSPDTVIKRLNKAGINW